MVGIFQSHVRFQRGRGRNKQIFETTTQKILAVGSCRSVSKVRFFIVDGEAT